MSKESIIQERVYEDVSTLVSIYPSELNEYKPGIYPGRFKIPECLDEENPVIVHIKPSIMLVQNPDKPVLQIETPSFRIVEAIVRDFYSSIPEVKLQSNTKPGICGLQGKVTLFQFKTNFKDLHEDLKSSQNRWFLDLKKRTDNDWNRYHSHKMIMPMAIHAAKKLGFTAENTEWLQDAQSVLESPTCPMCANVINTKAVVCNCGYIIKVDEYSEMVKGGRIVGKVA